MLLHFQTMLVFICNDVGAKQFPLAFTQEAAGPSESGASMTTGTCCVGYGDVPFHQLSAVARRSEVNQRSNPIQIA